MIRESRTSKASIMPFLYLAPSQVAKSPEKRPNCERKVEKLTARVQIRWPEMVQGS